MRRRVIVGVLAFALAGVISGGPSHAQNPVPTRARVQQNLVDIYLTFKVGQRTLSAGTYAITQASPDVLVLRSTRPGAAPVQVPVITRLAAPATDLSEPRLTFDTVRGQNFLSEVWLPGADGFLLSGPAGVNPHTVIDNGRPVAQRALPKGMPNDPHVINASFPFKVGDKVMPAGQYDVVQAGPELIVLRSPQPGGPLVQVPVMTRLAGGPTALAQPRVVFDTVNSQHYLAEVWLPGKDAFVLAETRVPHTHAAVNVVVD